MAAFGESCRRRGHGLAAATDPGCAKTKTDLVVVSSGGRIFAFFCSDRDHKPQNSGCGYTAQSFHTAWTQSGRGSRKHGALQQRVVDSRIGTYGTLAITGSRLDAGELDHLGPLLSFVDDQFSELSRRAGKHRAA
jgi:hypothetical protein